MPGKKKQSEPDEQAGAPEWMITFSDCMTLLLTFFVLLLSFSSFDERVLYELRIIFCNALPSVDKPRKRVKDAFLEVRQIRPTEDIDYGSEKPTLTRGKKDGLREEKPPEDFRRKKVFLKSSSEIFWARGTRVSSEGQKTLNIIGSFFKKVPGKIVISENKPKGDKKSTEFGLARGWAVLAYLANQGVDKNRFSITAMSTLSQKTPEDNEKSAVSEKSERRLEIVLLEGSISR